jgi:hypothetical protein
MKHYMTLKVHHIDTVYLVGMHDPSQNHMIANFALSWFHWYYIRTLSQVQDHQNQLSPTGQ